MANTYRKIILHVVFAVKYRQALLHKSWRRNVFGYIHEAINGRGNYCIKVGGYNDHVHILFDYKCKEPIEDIVREIKKASNILINQKYSKIKFDWQVGYGVFSVGWKEIDQMIKYVDPDFQERHHGKGRSFKDDYFRLLKEYEVEYKDEFVFEFFDNILDE